MKHRWMVDRRFDRCRTLRAWFAAALAMAALVDGDLCAQTAPLPATPDQPQTPELPSKQAAPPRTRVASRQSLGSGEAPLPPGLTNKTHEPRGMYSSGMPSPLPGMAGATNQDVVVKVVIDPPLKNHTEQAVRRYIKTIADRPFDIRTIQEDVKQLEKSKLFVRGAVTPEYQRVGDHGIIVIYKVIESPTIKYLKFYGQHKVKERHLRKQSGLKVGDQLDQFQVKDGATKVEEYYHEKGFNKSTVKILEGLAPGDRGVVYLVNEGQKQKIAKVEFEGNNIATDGRLKTQIQSKPPLLWLFKGEVDQQKINEDIGKLLEYYRNLGFLRAEISRELEWNEDQNWLTVRFIINEGPRYKIRSISFVGQRLFTPEQLGEKLKLKPGDFFDKPKLDKDRVQLQDKYGMKGYVFADIQQEPRLNLNPDELDQIDLVYQIEEGRPCIVSRIDVQISGDNPHTRRNTVLNRVSIHPGDILSTREVRDSERRLKGSALFKNTPGDEPHINIHRPDLAGESGLADRPGGFRGQSPDAPRRGAR
ncbi:MAG TPA: POTRA domain-containing protein [Pirellulales bacterium]|nr:POTRA domain-containing protein [Pirellulales bacterium]